MDKIIWFLIMVISMIELAKIWYEWFRFQKECRTTKTYNNYFKNYMLLALKTILPALLSIFGLLAVFLGRV